jgi:NAD(P)-dependent dehydrogenase (short-subunit alcohol dehydrogenase family)
VRVVSVPTVVITGGNAGIGKETAVALARAGMQVVITSRDRTRGRAALDEVRTRGESDAVELMDLDLADFASIRRFADDYLAGHDRLDVLVNNAGLVLTQRSETVDGFETTFGVNHLGHFLLTQLLLDRIRASAPARVVVVSSHAHKSARKGLDFDDLQSENGYSGFRVYGRTKLANIYFARELGRRLEGTGVTVNALHPGFVASRFGRDGDSGRMGNVAMVMGRPFAISPEKGARTSIYLATSPEVADVTGGYFYKCRPSTPTKVARDDEAARRLWAVSEELVATAS